MGFFDNFPYTNFHEMNIDWILKEFMKLKTYVEKYTAINNVGYAGVWDITKQYPQWSIVTNGENSYLSKQPVPVGIAIDNAEYWIHLADLDPRIAAIIKSISTLSAAQSIFNVENPPENSVAACAGDGRTDDTVAFQNAVNYAYNNKMLVYVPNKILISNNIKIPGGMTIFGNSNTIVNYDNYSFSNFDKLNSAIVTMNGSGLVLDDVWGGCIKNIAIVNGGSTAGVGLSVNRCRYWTFENININNYRLGMYLTTNNPVTSDDNTMYNTFINISARCATCLELDGVSGTASANGNCCHNTFVNLNLDCTTAGVVMGNCDNNTIVECFVFQRGGDWSFNLKKFCRSNYFYHVQGRVLYNGCGRNYIWGYDRENGQALPYAVNLEDDNFFSAKGKNYVYSPGKNGPVQMGGFIDEDWHGIERGSYGFRKNPAVGECIGECITDDGNLRYFGIVQTAIG